MDDTEERLRTLEKTMDELYSLTMGPPPARNNGINGTVKKLVIDCNAAMDWAHDIWYNKRRTECIMLKDVADLRKEVDEMAAAKINLKGVYVMGTLQFLGLVIVALIGLMK
jgi:hypothetical protein